MLLAVTDGLLFVDVLFDAATDPPVRLGGATEWPDVLVDEFDVEFDELFGGETEWPDDELAWELLLDEWELDEL